MTDESGVSEVIGALLVLVALTTLLALMQATTVPGMNKDAEAAHADKVLDEFFSLQEKVDEAGASGVARTAKITAGTLYPQVPFLFNPVQGTSGGVSLLQGQRVYVRYAANASSTPVSVSGRCFNIGGTGGCVDINSATPEESSLIQITSFTTFITSLEPQPPGNPRIRLRTTGLTTDLDIEFKNLGGTLEITWGPGPGCSGTELRALYFVSDMTPIDIMCKTELSSFMGSVSISFSQAGGADPAAGNYSLTGTRGTSGVQNSTPVNATAAYLNLSTNYNYWSPPGPVPRYEHGAVLRTTGSTTSMTSSSALLSASHDAMTNNTTLSVTVPRLNATNRSVGQREPLSLRLTPGALSRSQATAFNLTLEVGTPFPGLWSAYFNNAMNASGLPQTGNWSVATGADWARLEIERGSPPRLNLTVSRATVEAAL